MINDHKILTFRGMTKARQQGCNEEVGLNQCSRVSLFFLSDLDIMINLLLGCYGAHLEKMIILLHVFFVVYYGTICPIYNIIQVYNL